MNLQSLSVSWVDFLVMGVLGFGVWRGRKRGMSGELLDIIKWIVTVVAAGFLYQPVGDLLLQSTSFLTPLSCYLATYLALVILFAIVFSYIRKGAGDKLTGSDSFGSAEYYLGMFSGLGRYACILIVAFSFLNARLYSAEEMKANDKYQLDNFGSNFFITLPDLQKEVFTRSVSGRCVKDFLGFFLIESTPPGGGGVNRTAKARESSR